MSKLIFILTLFFSLAVFAKQANKPKYREGKKIDFESLLIEGEKKKPDYSVVTGNLGEQDLGLLKLRENFIDTMSVDASLEVEI